MSRVVQISILGKVSGNVNADGVIGDRTTIKRMYSSNGEVLPFVSARAIKYAIRQAFRDFKDSNNEYFKTDRYEDSGLSGQIRLPDSARPDEFIDNDLFGYMLTVGTGGQGTSYRRQAPIAISYFRATKDTPIKSEFGAKFPREGSKEPNPVPFEVEVAEFIGRLDVLIYDYVGDFTKSTTLSKTAEKQLPNKKLQDEERKARLSAFLNILLTPSYVLPRRTNSLNIPQYYAALVCMSKSGPLPVYHYLDYVWSDGHVLVNTDRLNLIVSREDIKDKEASFYLIDYNDDNSLSRKSENRVAGNMKNAVEDSLLKRVTVKGIIDLICDFIIQSP